LVSHPGIGGEIALRRQKTAVPLQAEPNQSFRKHGVELKVMNQAVQLSQRM
jgi:hypothetical protein